MTERQIDPATGQEMKDHEWDGIVELDTPLPRWWLWTFYITIVWGIGYCIAYPAWPLINSATAGLLGYSTRAEVVSGIADRCFQRSFADSHHVVPGDNFFATEITEGRVCMRTPGGRTRIVRFEDPLQDELPVPALAHPLDVLPGDGRIDELDIPDIVFITYDGTGVLRAVSGDGATEIFGQDYFATPR